MKKGKTKNFKHMKRILKSYEVEATEIDVSNSDESSTDCCQNTNSQVPSSNNQLRTNRQSKSTFYTQQNLTEKAETSQLQNLKIPTANLPAQNNQKLQFMTPKALQSNKKLKLMLTSTERSDSSFGLKQSKYLAVQENSGYQTIKEEKTINRKKEKEEQQINNNLKMYTNKLKKLRRKKINEAMFQNEMQEKQTQYEASCYARSEHMQSQIMPSLHFAGNLYNNLRSPQTVANNKQNSDAQPTRTDFNLKFLKSLDGLITPAKSNLDFHDQQATPFYHSQKQSLEQLCPQTQKVVKKFKNLKQKLNHQRQKILDQCNVLSEKPQQRQSVSQMAKSRIQLKRVHPESNSVISFDRVQKCFQKVQVLSSNKNMDLTNVSCDLLSTTKDGRSLHNKVQAIGGRRATSRNETNRTQMINNYNNQAAVVRNVMTPPTHRSRIQIDSPPRSQSQINIPFQQSGIKRSRNNSNMGSSQMLKGNDADTLFSGRMSTSGNVQTHNRADEDDVIFFEKMTTQGIKVDKLAYRTNAASNVQDKLLLDTNKHWNQLINYGNDVNPHMLRFQRVQQMKKNIISIDKKTHFDIKNQLIDDIQNKLALQIQDKMRNLNEQSKTKAFIHKQQEQKEAEEMARFIQVRKVQQDKLNAEQAAKEEEERKAQQLKKEREEKKFIWIKPQPKSKVIETESEGSSIKVTEQSSSESSINEEEKEEEASEEVKPFCDQCTSVELKVEQEPVKVVEQSRGPYFSTLKKQKSTLPGQLRKKQQSKAIPGQKPMSKNTDLDDIIEANEMKQQQMTVKESQLDKRGSNMQLGQFGRQGQKKNGLNLISQNMSMFNYQNKSALLSNTEQQSRTPQMKSYTPIRDTNRSRSRSPVTESNFSVNSKLPQKRILSKQQTIERLKLQIINKVNTKIADNTDTSRRPLSLQKLSTLKRDQQFEIDKKSQIHEISEEDDNSGSTSEIETSSMGSSISNQSSSCKSITIIGSDNDIVLETESLAPLKEKRYIQIEKERRQEKIEKAKERQKRNEQKQQDRQFVDDVLWKQFQEQDEQRKEMNMSQNRARYVENINPFLNDYNMSQTDTKNIDRPDQIKISRQMGNAFVKYNVNERYLKRLKEKLKKAEKQMNDEIQRLKDDEANELEMGNADGVLKQKKEDEQLRLQTFVDLINKPQNGVISEDNLKRRKQMLINLTLSVKDKSIDNIMLAKVYTVDRTEVDKIKVKINKAIGKHLLSVFQKKFVQIQKLSNLDKSDYKAKLGIDYDQSFFDQPNAINEYSELKQEVMEDFHNVNPDVTFDFEKKLYLDQIELFIVTIIKAFTKNDQEEFKLQMNKIAYLSLVKQEYMLTSKVFNIMGHAFLHWKKPQLAYNMFKKLRDVSRMDHDLETTMYAFKQCGLTCNLIKDYKKGLNAFKCMLQIAWHLNHIQGEMSSYYNIAITNFYLGHIQKSEYYINRFLRGQTEAVFSVVKKISLINTHRKYKGFDIKPIKSDGYLTRMINGAEAQTSKTIKEGIQELFSKHLINYSLNNKEIQNMLAKTQTPRRDNYRETDPTSKYIDRGTPLSQMSQRGLPSPCEIKGDAHLLLLPYYQELSESEYRTSQKRLKSKALKKEKRQQKRERDARNEQLLMEGKERGEVITEHSSDNGFTSDEIVQLKIKQDTSSKKQQKCISFALTPEKVMVHTRSDIEKYKFQIDPLANPKQKFKLKLQQKQRIDNLRNDNHQKAMKKEAFDAARAKIYEPGEHNPYVDLKKTKIYTEDTTLNMSAIIQKAKNANLSSKNKVNLTHLNINHLSPSRKRQLLEIEGGKFEQIKKSLNVMHNNVKQEQERIFLPKQAYEKLTKDLNYDTETKNQYGNRIQQWQYSFPENT